MPAHLVGREKGLRRAQGLLDDRGVVVVAGASGIGKTAFSDALAVEWAENGSRVLEMRGTHGFQNVPFGSVAAFLRLEIGGSQTEMIERAVASMTDSEEPVMVVVDDAQLLDPESAALISGLSQAPDVHLVIAVTSGESVPSDITAIWVRWPECRIDLDPLTRDEVGEMAVGLLGQDLDDSLLDEISSVTLGYPLFVAALVVEISDQLEDSDTTSLKSLPGSSDRLIRLLERRLSRLDRDERRLFDTVAFAELVPTDVIAKMAAVTSLSRLETGDLVRVRSQHVSVTHPLLAATARQTLTVEGRRSCAQLLLDGIDDQTDPGDVAALVRKALGVGVVPAPDQLEVAAQITLTWQDFSGAARIAAHAPHDQQLVVLRAKALRFLGEIPDEVPIDLDEDVLAEFLSSKSQAMAYGERRFSEAITLMKDGLATVTEPSSRNRIALELMILSGLAGDLDTLLDGARAVSVDADSDTRLLAISAALVGEGLTLSTSTSPDTYAKGLRVAELVEPGSLLAEQLEMGRALADLAEGNFAEARARFGSNDQRTAIGSWLTIESVLADAWLPINEARRLAESAVDALESFDPLGNLPQARFVSELRAAQARLPRPSEEVVEQSLEPAVAAIDRLMDERAQAWYEWGDDDPAAGKRLTEVGREAVSLGHRFWGLSAFIDAIRLGKAGDVVTDIEQLVITRGAGLAVVAGRCARAETRDDPWESARIWWEAGATTYAIESAIRAVESTRQTDNACVQLMTARGAEPVVGDITEVAQPLSERQAEIVLSVLGGASNEETADALFLSKRTVENHLHRVYQTLGIGDGRDGLIDRFGWI